MIDKILKEIKESYEQARKERDMIKRMGEKDSKDFYFQDGLCTAYKEAMGIIENHKNKDK
jgi:hypothetical protein